MINLLLFLFLQDSLILAGLFILLVWLLAEWTSRRDAEAIEHADGPSKAQVALLLVILYLLFRRRGNDG